MLPIKHLSYKKRKIMIKNSIRKRTALAYLITLAIPFCTVYSAQQPSISGQYGKPIETFATTEQNTNTESQTEATVVSIHHIVKTLNKEADCNLSQWNEPEDACTCCLMYHKGKRGNKKSADAIIEQCIKTNKQCTESTISAVKKRYNLPATASSQELFDKLEDGIVTKNMTVDKSFLESSGAFTEASLPKFLAQAYNEKKLKNDAFSKEACLKAKNLGTQGGYNTLQLFLITSTCHPKEASMYIIKEARSGLDEATKLRTVEEFPKMKELIAPKIMPGLPTIALPFAYFSYPDTKSIHYLATMPAAKGKDLSTLITEFKNNQSSQNKEILNRAFAILGKETANFHKRFMKTEKGKILGKTVVHGDFHTFNLFFDPIGGHFTFIDNETIANSLNNLASPAVDLVKLFFMPFSINTSYQQFRDLINGIELKTWLEIALKNFITGYKDAYKQTEQQQVLQELKKMFNDRFTIQWVDFDDNQLSDLRKNYINPIFDELMKK